MENSTVNNRRIEFNDRSAHINEILRYNRGKYPKFFVTTLGCQMNHADSEQIEGMLMMMGYAKAESMKDANMIVFNTCCVRENAEMKLYGQIGKLKELKAADKSLITAVCGCMMQQEHVVEKIKKSYHYIDIVFGTHNRHCLAELIYKRIKSDKRVFEIWKDSKGIAYDVPVNRQSGITAYVPVTNGCNNFCSYCIVPYVRGREISREPEDIVKDIVSLSKSGIKEITLLGQNVNSYDYGIDFSGLLYKISDIPKIERIRFMTSHPKDLSDSLISAIKNIPKICPHIHLPLQSGSTKVLKEMNRKYTKEQYLELVETIRKQIPGISVSTDIIVGYPGETEQDFADTSDVYRKAAFDFAYTFIYSKRTGTPAATRQDQVPDPVKNERFSRLVDLVNEYTLKSNLADENKVLSVLVEGKSRTDETIYTGRSGTNKIVNFKADNDFTGDIIDVKINKGHTWHLEGEKI